QVNSGIIRKDLAKITESRARLRDFSVAELFTICARVGDLFANGTLPLGDQGHQQSPQQYVETLSATSGLPHNLVRRNMAKIESVLARMPQVVRGLTRGLNPEILDEGTGEHAGVPVTYFASTQAL